MNFTLLLSALRARFRVFFLILGTTVLAAILASLLVPKTYIANVSLLVDGKDEQSLQTGQRTPERERTGYLQTQIDIITSPKVAQRVVRELKLGSDPAAIAAVGADNADVRPGGSIDDVIAERIAKRLKVDTSQSSVVQLAFSASDPDVAARIANGFAQSYVETALELRTEPTRKASAWFEDQLKGLRANLEQAEQRLATFRQEHGIAALEERYDVDSLQLSELASIAGRNRDGGVATFSDMLNSPTLQAMRADLRRAEARLQEMSSEYGVNHPAYQRQLAQVQSLREALSGETSRAVTGVEPRSRRSLNADIEAQKQRVLAMAQARTQMAVLVHDANIAQRTYDEAMQRYLSSNIESRAMQTNVSVLDPAAPPARPARPKMVLNIGIALVVGALLGLAAVHLLEMFDQRVRIIEDLASDVHVPLLAVLDKWNPVAERLAGPQEIRRALPGPG